ncbi:PLP-dependent aminotransferase family protein [Alkalihalophilus marmarensis]|uniref:Aminotransferase n=1 Tax=Alkalihalophilus marmarensis DSM 21297 TaxID=1188261 RepID=U6SJ44_9BACI|nr:PLP-dependent aminotransferase family protein [Alkalihalophilus marmarensis]ERN51608.1 aminotransferase [Alkalihalophilus marmarensis DSM 21297]
MNIESFLSKHSKPALQNDPPGSWMPQLPEKCIRLSSGYPDPSLVPVEQLNKAVNRLLEEEGDLPLHYLGSPRIDQLKTQINHRLKERGMDLEEEELLITSGACQAIDLIARVFIDEDSVVAVESPTYMEALEIFQNYTNHFISIPIDEQGLQTEKLEKMLEDRSAKDMPLPRLLYTIPTFHNPTGTTMTAARRKHVIKLAEEYNFLVLEDDAYGDLYFEKPEATLKSLDQSNRVLHVGSLSKVVAPGMRIGWVAAGKEFTDALNWFKKDLDQPFAQASMAAYLEQIDLNERLYTLRTAYQQKRDVLISALEEHLPDSVSWNVPKGGYFIWVKADDLDTAHLLDQALDAGVAYVPGKYFFLPSDEKAAYLRLSFSYASEDELVEGVKLLANVLKRS